MIKRKPMPLNVNHENYNNNNLLQYDPYIIDDNNNVKIDEEWWNSLTPFIKKLINDRLSKNFILGKVEVPHEINNRNDDRLLKLYQSYLDGFDYHVWYNKNISNGPKNVKIINISLETKQMLMNKNLLELHSLKDDIDEYINSQYSADGYFIRLSSTSGKNEKPIRAFYNSEDIINHLVSLDIFVSREYERDKDTCLIIMPYKTDIDKSNEFRIFVVNNRLTAVSPQYWFIHNQYSSEELEAFEYALNNIPFIDDIPYSTFVADIYIDVGERECHLIELNPFGAQSGAGASFFNWIDDYNILYGKINDYSEFRYLSAISY